MPEYIDRNAAIAELINDMNNDCGMYDSYEEKIIRDKRYKFAIDKLREFLAENVKPVRRGRWVMDDYTHRYRCSMCNAYQPYDTIDADIIDYWDCNFCPICGADMRNEEGNNGEAV